MAVILLMLLTLILHFSGSNSQEQHASYWTQTYPSLALPTFIEKRLSTLSASQVNQLQHLIVTNTLSTHLAFFCKSANLVCTNDNLVGMANTLDGNDYSYGCGRKKDLGRSTNKKTNDSTAGRFFREDSFKDGTLVTIPNLRHSYPSRSFLPYSIASRIPLVYSTLKSLFHASEDMDRLIREAMVICEEPTSLGKEKMCVTSLKELVEFPLQVFGQKNLTLFTSETTNGSVSSAILTNVNPLLKEQESSKMTTLSCHELFLPYMAMYCHSTEATQLYEATLVDPRTHSVTNQRLFAICHRDTSSWNPGHEAFALLKGQPGEFSICHWMSPTTMAWVDSTIW